MTQRAIVTGGAGFIGSHLVDALVADGADVLVIDDLSHGDAGRLPDGVELARVSVTDRDAVDTVADAFAPTAVFHLAAQASVTASVEDPGHDCAVNVGGTLTALELSRRHRAPLVLTSTAAMYGSGAPVPTSEDHPPAPESPYGASKWAAEAYVNTWALAHHMPHAICRLSNVYGPRQDPHGEAGVVAILSRRLFDGQPPTLYGQGKPTRDYIYVGDVVAGLRAAHGHRGTFNLSTGIPTDVLTLCETMRSEAQSTVKPQLAPLREGELEDSTLDPGRARAELGWRAATAVDSGLRATYRALAEQFGAESDQS